MEGLSQEGVLEEIDKVFVGQERWLGYGLLGIGVILAVVDMFRKGKPSKNSIK